MPENFLTRFGKSVMEKVSPTQTLGTSMTNASEQFGFVGFSVAAPDRMLNLTGQRRWDEFHRMVRDISIVAAGVRLFLNLMANAVWTLNPPEGLSTADEAKSQEHADQIYKEIYGLSNTWSSVVRKTAAFRLYGFSVQEWTAKRNDDGSIGLLDVEHRPQRTIARWVRDPSGTVEAVVQRVSGRGDVTLPRSKIVYAVDDVLTDSPEGSGLFQHLYATAKRLDQFLELEEIGYTTDLRGIPIARAPLGEEEATVNQSGPENSDARKRASGVLTAKLRPLRDFLNKHLRNRSSGFLLPSDTYRAISADGAQTPSNVPKWALELLNGQSSSFEAMAGAIKRMNVELARVLGTEHLLLGADGTGSLALARSKMGTFYLTVTSSLQDLVDVYQRDLVEPLAELNGWPEELWPEMGVNEISDRDIDQVASVLLKMAQAGATLMPDDPAIGEMRDMAGLSRPTEDSIALAMDASLNPARNQPPPPQDPNAPPDPKMNANPEDGVAKVRQMRPSKRKRRR